MKRSRVLKWVLVGVLAALLLAALAVGAVGRNRLAARTSGLPDLSDGAGWYWQNETTFVADGVAYTPRENLFTLLCIGLGTSDERQAAGQVQGLGIADTLVLVCFDRGSGQLILLCVPRDTQAPIRWCDDAGNAYLTQNGHIAMQYAYGGGTHEVCSKNTAETLSETLYGAGIDTWLTVDMDSIVTLVDAVDGVPITVPDDPYYCAYTGYQPGQWVRLDGPAALQFVQYRDITVFASCEMRVERQKVFLDALLDLLKKTVQKMPYRLPGIYAAMQEELYMELTLPELAVLAVSALRVQIDQIAMNTLPGQVRSGILFEEYHLDEPGTRQMLLDAYFQKAE